MMFTQADGNKLARIETITRTLGYSETTIEDARERLNARASVAEASLYRLQDAASAYEAQTSKDTTTEQEARLERLINSVNRAHRIWQNLEHRAELLGKALSAIEDAMCVRRDRQDALTRGRNKRRKANTSD